MSKRLSSTDKTELVETHNIALSLQRLIYEGPYDIEKWKRALYHALGIACPANCELEKIRQALGLP